MAVRLSVSRRCNSRRLPSSSNTGITIDTDATGDDLDGSATSPTTAAGARCAPGTLSIAGAPTLFTTMSIPSPTLFPPFNKASTAIIALTSLARVRRGPRRNLRRLPRVDHQRNGVLRIVRHRHQPEFVGIERALRNHRRFHPVEQPPPVRLADQHDRKRAKLAGLDQRQRFEQFIQRAETAWKDDETDRVFDEHRL